MIDTKEIAKVMKSVEDMSLTQLFTLRDHLSNKIVNDPRSRGNE